jgi:alkylation response protein AidB-like acyl-CoA dehydrogenase
VSETPKEAAVDFELSDEQVLLRDSTRRLLESATPISEVRRLADSDTRYDATAWARGVELGWPVLALPESAGGVGGDFVDLTIVAEEHGRAVNPGPIGGTALVAIAAARHAPDALRDEIVASVSDASETAAWAFAEPRRPWNIGGLRATATKTGDGFQLAGTKTAVEGAVGARWLLVTTLLDDAPANFLIDTTATPVPVRATETLDITRRFGEIDLDGVVAPESTLLAGADEESVQRLLDEAAVLVCADAVGVGEHLLQASVEYAKVRVQFGRPIGSFQAIKHKCANMRLWLQGSRVATYFAAMSLAAGTDDAAAAAATAKAYVSDAIRQLAAEALQVHGGIGMTWEHDLHLYYRRAKTDEILSGDTTLHRQRLTDATVKKES